MADSFNELMGIGGHSEDAALEGWWLCDDNAASTQITDRSSNAAHITAIANTDTGDVAGPNSWLPAALDLPTCRGSRTAVVTAVPCTFLSRISADTGSGNDNLIVHRGSSSNALGMALVGGLASMYAGATSYTVTSAGSSLAGAGWKHLAARFIAADNRDLMLDGTSIATSNVSRVPASIATFEFGHFSNTDTFDGKVADVAIFSRALTQAEVAEHYNGPEPVNSVAPAVSGTETEGETLSVTTGTWGLDSPFSSGTNGTITYAYQWTRSDDGSGTSEADISGATSSTYELQSADVGKYIRCRVRASNTGGYDADQDTASDFTGEIQAGAPPSGGSVGRGLLTSSRLSRLSLVG